MDVREKNEVTQMQPKCFECKYLANEYFIDFNIYTCKKNGYSTLRQTELRVCSDFRKKEGIL